LFLREGQHHHRGTVAHEHRLAARKDSPVEPKDSVGTEDITCSLEIGVSNVLSANLRQVLEQLKRPDHPVAEHGCGAGTQELAQLVVHVVGVSPPAVDLHKVPSHNAHTAWVNVRKSFVHSFELPSLACLPINFSVLKRALQNGTERARKPASSEGAPLDAA